MKEPSVEVVCLVRVRIAEKLRTPGKEWIEPLEERIYKLGPPHPRAYEELIAKGILKREERGNMVLTDEDGAGTRGTWPSSRLKPRPETNALLHRR